MPNTVEVDATPLVGGDAYDGKPKNHYVALIKGPGDRFSLERSFVRPSYLDSDDVTAIIMPERTGVYEVRDYPGGTSKRTRYYQVKNGAMALLDVLNDEDVLDAVETAKVGAWSDFAINAEAAENGAGKPVADTLEVMSTIDDAEEQLVQAFNEGLDEEDVRMQMDRIRRVVERL